MVIPFSRLGPNQSLATKAAGEPEGACSVGANSDLKALNLKIHAGD